MNFKIIRTFKTCLERQIAEAVRIPRRGEFNRRTITRLVLDNDWEKKKWDEAWDARLDSEGHQEVGCDVQRVSRKVKQKIQKATSG